VVGAPKFQQARDTMNTALLFAVFGLGGIASGFFAGLFGIGGGLIMVPVLVRVHLNHCVSSRARRAAATTGDRPAGAGGVAQRLGLLTVFRFSELLGLDSRATMELGAVTDAADGGIADRGGGRGSYRVIDFKPAKFCSGPIVRVHLNHCVSSRARRAAATTAVEWLDLDELDLDELDLHELDLHEPAVWWCAVGGAGVFVLAELLGLDSRATMELGAVTDAADGGIADRGGGRGSYRVIDFKPAKFCSGPIVRVHLNHCVSSRARRAAATRKTRRLPANRPVLKLCL
jgi:hypothetical protein